MFTPLGLFKDVPCPHGQQCSLGTCIFSHARNERALRGQNTTRSLQDDGAPTYTPLPKRIKLSDPTEDRQPAEDTTLASENERAKPSQNPQGTSQNDGGRKLQAPQHDVRDLTSISREVSPPPTKSSTQRSQQRLPLASPGASASLQPSMPARQAPKESLNPRMLPKAPGSHAARSSILNKLHATMSTLNQKLEGDKEWPSQHLILTPQELVTMALDEEEKIARENPSIYPNVIKLRIVKLSKMNKEDWAKEVEAHLISRYYKTAPRKEPQKPAKFTTGLSSQEEIAVCRKLITPLKGLEKYGYVTKPPSDDEVSSARKGVIESKGWEKCDRCGGRFQVFPGRREDGTLTSGGECTYHPARPLYPPKKQTDHMTGHKDPYYPCCHETVGTSAGCTKAKTHVFKVSESKRLASILQFEETPLQPDKGPQQPVCFDCEMGYTTLGLELIRLTAVTWPDGRDLIDVLVRPMGEILDLNSRYSGVFPEHMSKAVPYSTTIPDINSAALEDGEIDSAPLQIVESPAAARALLFSFLQPDTPLIGHAIDNDLNTCRIIHPTIIDTVLLFPHPRGLPIRLGLRALCKKHLDRDIQTAGAQGHDSREDAIATGDLVRFKAAETWKVLKGKGWRIENGRLVAPPGVEDSDETAPGVRSLGPGAGHKRKPSESQS